MPFIKQLQAQFRVNLESFSTDHLSRDEYRALKEFVAGALQPNVTYHPLKSYLISYPTSTIHSVISDLTPELELLCQAAAFFDTHKVERHDEHHYDKLIDLICSNKINNNPIILLEIISVIQFVFQGISRRIQEINAGQSGSIQGCLSSFGQYATCSTQLIQHNPPVTLDQCIISIYNLMMLLNYQLLLLDHCENTPEQYSFLVTNAEKIKNFFAQINRHHLNMTKSCFAPTSSAYALTGFKNMHDLQGAILGLFDNIADARAKFITPELDGAKKFERDTAFAAIETLIADIEAINTKAFETDQPLDTRLYEPATVAAQPGAAAVVGATTDARAVATSHPAVTL